MSEYLYIKLYWIDFFMTRLLIFIFMLNALLPSTGLMAMPSSMDYTMSQTLLISSDSLSMTKSPNGVNVVDSDHCNTDQSAKNMQCKAKCATACAQLPALSSTSLLLPIALHSSKPITVFAYFYTRSISPELHPPSV